jgi:negative regulator of sigma E activity
MDPFFAKNRLSAYIDGVLPEREAAEVAEAIARDPELKGQYESLRTAVRTLRQHGAVSAPEGFKARVMATIEREPSQAGSMIRFRRFFARLPVEALAVAAAALLVVFATVSQMEDSSDLALVPPISDPEPVAEVTAEAAEVPDPSSADIRPAAATDRPSPSASPQQAKPAPSKKPSVGGITPKAAARSDEAYIPEWEASNREGKAAFGGSEGLALSVSDSEVLSKVHLLTERVGGQMLDEARQPLQPHALSTEAPVARVLLLVPVDQTSALRSQLVAWGAVSAATPSNAATLAAGFSGIYLEARLLP